MVNVHATSDRPGWAGLVGVSPVIPGVLAFGLIAGVAAADAGYTLLQSLGASMLLFAGASQIAMSQLVIENSLAVIIVLTAWVINLRFAMYSASLAPYLAGLSVRRRAALAYILVDQSYALCITRYRDGTLDDRAKVLYFVGSALPLWILWQITTTIGFFLGEGLPASWQLGYAVPLIFLVLIVPNVTDRPTLAAALVGGSVSVLTVGLPLNLGLLAGAASGIVAGLVVEGRRRGLDPEAEETSGDG